MNAHTSTIGPVSANLRAPISSRAQAFTFARLPEGVVQRKCSCGGSAGASGKCEECEKEGSPLQRRATGSAGPTLTPPAVRETIRSAGQPLDRQTGPRMEAAFGHSFANVRVHTNAKAAESARAVSALAYTVGESVVFGAGQFAPHTAEGSRLLAHELAHVLQQRSGAVAGGDEKNLEAQADRRAARAISGARWSQSE